MGIVERWTTKVRERKAKEAAALKAYRAARSARRAAERVVKRHKGASGPDKAIAYAHKYLGVRESPAGSNSGPHITGWCRDVNMTAGPWCGAFMHACLEAAGVTNLSWRMRYTPYIVDDARHGINGLVKLIPLADAKPGDLLLFNWDGGVVDHVGIFLGRKGTNVLTIEGNTSVEGDTRGSQSNGGIVAARTRNPSTIQFVVRPRYAA